MYSGRVRGYFISGIIILSFSVVTIVIGIKGYISHNTATINFPENSKDTFSVEPNKSVSQLTAFTENISKKEVANNTEIDDRLDLDFIDQEAISQSRNKAAEALWKERYGKTTEFVKLQWREGMNYNLVKEMVNKDQLPILYILLDDEEYAPYWHNIARIIAYISDDPDSVPVLLNYFQRDDGSKIGSLPGKVGSIALIGIIGGDTADSILRKAITKEGAKDFAKSWINEEKWKESDKLGKDFVVSYTQGAAILGLVYTGKKENWDIVKILYNEQKEIAIKNQKQTDIMSSLIDAMAKIAFIADNKNDVEAYLSLDKQIILKTLKPYLDIYSLHYPR